MVIKFQTAVIGLLVGTTVLGQSATTAVAQSKELKKMDIKFMLQGYCHAGSRTDQEAPGGHAVSDNNPKKLADYKLGKIGEVTLVAMPDDIVTFANGYEGIRLLLINRTTAETAFPASDSRLSIIQEALDTDGKWKPIEYLPSSWCGNSYHRVFLPSVHF